MIADQREFERQQAEAEQQRRRAMDERQAAMMQAQLEQMQFQRTQAEAAAKRQQEADARDAYEGGYRRADDAARVGGAMQATGAGLGPMGTAVDAVAGYGRQMQQAAKAPAFTMGGTPMAKTAESLVERVQRLQAQQREGEAMQARQDRAAERAEDRTFQAGEKAKDRAATLAAIRERLAGASGASQPAAPRLRVVPAGTTQDFQGINSNLRELLDIEQTMTQKPKAAAEALGLKNMLPEFVATRGMSEDALTLRGKLSNVASGIFLERSGAAVTPSEAKRLEGWTANLTDNPTKALNAIKNIRAFYEQKARDMAAAYGPESGYYPVGGAQSAAPDVQRDAAAATTVAPRRPGETIAQWRARTGGQ